MPTQSLRSTRGVVSAAMPEGAEAGAAVLREGGNAVDAAVTAAAALAVAEPHSTGFGGYGGVMVVHMRQGRSGAAAGEAGQPCTACIDFGARAPEAAQDGMFRFERVVDGEMYAAGDENRNGPKACGMPTILAGLERALTEFGTIALSRALEPAVELCERGIAPPATLIALRQCETMLRRYPESARIFLPGGDFPTSENPIAQRDLAEVLREVQGGGPAAFYKGRAAELTHRYMTEAGGIMRQSDWAGKDAEGWRGFARVTDPVTTQYRDWTICTSPELTGGPTVAQVMRLAHHLELYREGRDTAGYAHLLVEAMKTAWRDRLSRYGAPEFCECDIDRLLADERLVAQAADILARREVGDDVEEADWRQDQGADVRGFRSERPDCTTHVGAADRWGNVVSLTLTHGSWFGCGVTIPGTGILLNNAMSRFDPRGGRPNSVGPGKRVLHNMAPTLILKSGQPLYSLGLPGGRKIPNIVAQYVLDLRDRGASPREAIWTPKLHVEACEPVSVEGERMSEEAWAAQENHYSEASFSLVGGKKRGWPPWVLDNLEARGHEVRLAPGLGGIGHVLKVSALMKTVEAANGPGAGGDVVEE